MKVTRLTLCMLLVLASSACSRPTRPGTIAPDQAAAHVGQTVTVEGTVSEVYTARSGSATFIDMGGQYPNNAFAGVIFASDMGTVGDVRDLSGETVDIHGDIRLYRSRPEIVIRSRDQVKVQKPEK